MAATPTPADLSITPRDRRFARDVDVRRLGGGRAKAAVLLALSVTFPRGEALFVDSVKRFRDGASATLARDIAAFVRQEVAHSCEHLAFNRRIAASGYDVSRLEANVADRLDELARRPAIYSLATTIALEHFTAVFAHLLLIDDRMLDGTDAETAALWRWHAVEEIEHKGVAYDVWLHATRDWSPARRYALRAIMMLTVTRHFLHDRTAGIVDLLMQDGMSRPRALAAALWTTMVSPGLMRRTLGSWLGYFRPGFHPWHHDDRALIAGAEERYAIAA